MPLKLRYALFLLLVLLLLALFSGAILYCITRGYYLAALLLLAALYGCTYLLGRRFAKIFFVLSILRLLRKNNGVLPRSDFEGFIARSLASRRAPAQRAAFGEELLAILTAEGLIAVQDDSLVLLK